MRIGLLSEFVYPFHRGGAEKRFYEVATRLAARGHDVHWFGMHHWDGPPTMAFEGVTLHAVGQPIHMYASDGQRAIAPAVRLSLMLSRGLGGGPDFDLVDCSLYPFFHVLGARAARRGTPLVVTWHEFWGRHWYEYLGWRGFFGKQVERTTARVATQIVAVSEIARAGLADAGVPPERLTKIYNGVDVAAVERVPAAAESTDVVFFGRLKNHKNIDIVIAAVAELASRGRDISCSIVGDGPERRALEQLARRLGVADRVRFAGALSDEEMLAAVKASGVFVNPSTKEGGGSITLLEANAAGVPVIAVRHPMGIDAELIDEGRNGWWITEAAPVPLADAIVTALQERKDRPEELRAACLEYARRYDWAQIAEQYESTYEEVVRRCR